MKILVIAPHPDDEVLGCGATIKKYSKRGDEVYLCIATEAYTPVWTQEYIDNKKKEIVSSNRVLGITKTFFLNLPTVRLDTIPQKDINDAIAKCISKIEPEILYVPHRSDLNKDHQIIFESALVAARTKPGSSIKRVLSYETLSETEWGAQRIKNLRDVFLPTVYIDIRGTLKYKIKAMECYKSELKKFPHPRSLKGITVLSEKRGMEAGLENAEAFVLVKEIIKDKKNATKI